LRSRDRGAKIHAMVAARASLDRIAPAPPSEDGRSVGRNDSAREAWVRTVGIDEAMAENGELARVYAGLKAGAKGRPAVYTTPHGDAPNIIRCHGLDPEGMRLAFSLSGAIHWGEGALPWRLREMINTVTSRANDCFY
jgi:hypothetical protein